MSSVLVLERAQASDQRLRRYALRAVSGLLTEMAEPERGGIPSPCPPSCAGNKNRLERTASRPHRTRFEPPKATDAGPNLAIRPNVIKTSWPPGFRTRKISRSANGATSASSSRETQTAASIDEDALGRLSKEPYSIRSATRSPGSKSGGLAAQKITSLPSKTRSDNSEADIAETDHQRSAECDLRRHGSRKSARSRPFPPNGVGEERVSATISFAEGFSDSAMILFAASATLAAECPAHAIGAARMPRTLDEPVLGGEPAGFAARRFQIDVLCIAKKLERRGAEQNHAPSYELHSRDEQGLLQYRYGINCALSRDRSLRDEVCPFKQ